SYTFKIYDYNRLDSDGNKRPIHLTNGRKVADINRRTNWVNNNIAIEPILTEEGVGYREYLVGNTDLMYYQTKRVEIQTGHKASFKNNNQFTILTLVDGEKASIYSKENPDFKYNQNYLDIVIVPASIHEYVIENKGYQPIVVHKVMLK
ncbi:MAG: phosphoheptose isomerase, partial [Clostridium sp.]